MKQIVSVIVIMIILVSIAPIILATGAGTSGSGTATLNLTKPDTGITDQSLLQEIKTPYPSSLNMLFVFVGAAIIIIVATILIKKAVKKHKSKHRDIYGRW